MYRYDAVKDAPGMNPTPIETHQCCLSTGTTIASIYVVCQKKNGENYSFSQDYTVPAGCRCKASDLCI